MERKNYSILFAWIVIVFLLLIFVLSVKKQKEVNIQIKWNTPIVNNVIFPNSEPKLDNTSSWILVDTKEIDTLIIKPETIDDVKLALEELPPPTNFNIDNNWDEKKNYININSTPEECNKISNPELKNWCLDNYYNNTALKSLDLNICSEISNLELKNNCNYGVVLKKIESPNLNQWIEICDILTWENKIYCQSKFTKENDWIIMQNAVKANEIKLCDDINNVSLRLRCNDVINFKLAINSKDINNCSLISDEKLKSQCKDTLTITN